MGGGVREACNNDGVSSSRQLIKWAVSLSFVWILLGRVGGLDCEEGGDWMGKGVLA